MRIDVHSHFMSPALAQAMEDKSDFPYSRLSGNGYQFHCCPGMTLSMAPPMTDMARKLADMDSAGIDVAVLSLGVPGPEFLEPDNAAEMAQVANDLLAEIVARHPDRFWGYATLGFGNVDASLQELDRCVDELGFRGLQMFSNIAGKPLDSPELRPILEHMAELKLPIFVHPGIPLNRNYLTDLVPVPVLAFIVDSTLAAMRLALSGVLEQLPDLRIIIPHVGATIPYLMGRLDGMLPYFGSPDAIGEPSRFLKKLYMDTIAYEPEPLRWCYSLMGASQLLFGSDHPYADWKRPVQLLDELDCTDDERELMLHGNAERLFGKPGRA